MEGEEKKKKKEDGMLQKRARLRGMRWRLRKRKHGMNDEKCEERRQDAQIRGFGNKEELRTNAFTHI